MRILPVCSLMLAWTTAVFAQNSTGTITGVVRDPSNAVLPAAKVTVTNEATGLTRSSETNSTGEYRVPFLPVGVYSVRVEKKGFKTQKQIEIPLDVLQVRAVDFSLQLGAVNETVTVEGQAPLLDTS